MKAKTEAEAKATAETEATVAKAEAEATVAKAEAKPNIPLWHNLWEGYSVPTLGILCKKSLRIAFFQALFYMAVCRKHAIEATIEKVIRIGDIFAPINGAHAGERLLVIAVTRDSNHDDQAIVATTTNSISRVRLWTANIDYFSEGDVLIARHSFLLHKPVG